MRRTRPWVVVAAVNGLMAIAFGAYAAHGLAGDPYARQLADRASQYQLVHALALLAAERLTGDGNRAASASAALFTLGMILFSGSLYLKALTGPLAFPLFTPSGGVALMLGWLALGIAGAVRGK
ncbi:MAG: DUF423 domain-containing protein [Magnetospirillum sp.]|nr:DUF423 domain-containing protein [Magnetospirillum sp.]